MKVTILAKPPYFDIYGRALAKEFNAIHIAVDSYEPPLPISRSEDWLIVVGPNVYNGKHIDTFRGRKVAILTEQLPHCRYPVSSFVVDRYNQFLRDKDRYDLYIEWSEANAEFLRLKFPNLPLKVFPHGFIDCGPGSTEIKYDACFFGSLSERRKSILKFLRNNGVKLNPQHEDIWGKEKYDVIRQSKIMLNLHFADNPMSFEAPRIFDAISVGKTILSESINMIPEELTPNMFLTNKIDEMVKVCLEISQGWAMELGLRLRSIARTEYSFDKLKNEIL